MTKSHRNLRRSIKNSCWDLRRGGAPGVELLKDRDVGGSLGSSAGSDGELLQGHLSLKLVLKTAFLRMCVCVCNFGLIKAGLGSG